MSEAQTWTILISLLTASATTFVFIWRLTTQTLGARFEAIDHEFDSIHSRFDSMDYKFDALGTRIDRVEYVLGARIDRVEDVLGTKIDELGRRTSVLEDDVR